MKIHLSSSALYHHRALKSYVGFNQVHKSSEESFKQYMVVYLRICHYPLRESPEQLNWFSKERKFLSWSLSCFLWWIWSYLQGVHQRWIPSVIIDGIENHENKNWQASWKSFLFPHINFFLMEIVQIYHYHDISIKLTAIFQLLICMINHLFISLS